MSGEWERENGGGYENGDDRSRDWERERDTRRSQSPRSRSPRRERSPRRYEQPSQHGTDSVSEERKPDVENPGSNLFVSGIAPRMTEDELEELFSKYGKVGKVQIMVDPHTRESRGFGFVEMVSAEEADAAKDALTGEEKYGRVMSIEKARRGRARTPTPGKYFGPPKRTSYYWSMLTREGDGPPRRGPPRDFDRGGYGRDRYESRGYDDRYDRRGGGGGGRRDYGDYDRYERPRYDDRYAPSRDGARDSHSGRRDDYYYDSRR